MFARRAPSVRRSSRLQELRRIARCQPARALALPLGDSDPLRPCDVQLLSTGGAAACQAHSRRLAGAPTFARPRLESFSSRTRAGGDRALRGRRHPLVSGAAEEWRVRSPRLHPGGLYQCLSGLLSARRLARRSTPGPAHLALDRHLSRRFDFAQQVDSRSRDDADHVTPPGASTSTRRDGSAGRRLQPRALGPLCPARLLNSRPLAASMTSPQRL